MAKRTVKELVAEIERHKARCAELERQHSFDVANLEAAHDEIDATKKDADRAKRKVELLETDLHNLLGTIRVMADSSREVRIRRSTVRDADIALAMPQRNTD